MAELARFMAVRDCARGTLFYTPDDSNERLFILKSGSVELYQVNAQGKRVTLERLSAGAVFGEMSIVSQTMHGGFAEAVEPSLVCSATREDLVGFLAKHPEVAIRLLEAVGRRLKELEDRFAQLALSPVRVRVAGLLLDRMDPSTKSVTGLSHADLGQTVGALRQTVTESLGMMADEGVIELGHKRIKVLREDELRRMIREAG